MARNGGLFLRVWAASGLAVLLWTPANAFVDKPSAALTSDDVVRRLVEQNKIRADRLLGYADERHYTVAYHGFPRSLSADMVVRVTYAAPATKHFQIVTQTGSKVLADRVLKKLLEGEEEATRDQSHTALTPANYRFELLGQENRAGHLCFVLHVEPRVESKFLYRGTVWVDAQDFAVGEIEAVPAKNPSFWIKRTKIHHTYQRYGQFWLPHSDRSETAVRLGGTAELAIDYGQYQLQAMPGH